MQYGSMKEHLDHISKEVKLLKKMLVYEEMVDKQKTEAAWQDLLSAVRLVSEQWKGVSAVEEISEQREKTWR